MVRYGAELVKTIISLVLPPTCVQCGAVLAADEASGVCPDCWKSLPFWQKELEPMPMLPDNVDSFAAPFVYEEPIKGWVTALKFGDRLDLAPVLAGFLVRYLPPEADMVVPVPMYMGRLRQRKFNQALELVKRICKRKGLPWRADALKRVKDTKAQVGRTRKQRVQLPLNAFWADKTAVAGKHIVLVDDIWTTGTTARVCATVLKKAGAARVDVITVAYVAP